MRVLVVDDDPAVSGALNRALRLEGYEVSLAGDGPIALEQIAVRPPDAVVLDVGLPTLDGLEVCRRLRAAGDDTPVLMLTARDASTTASKGSTPVPTTIWSSPSPLPSSSPACGRSLRRRPEDPGELLTFADLQLDPVTREAKRGDRTFSLTRIEYDLLELLLRHPRQVLTRELILDRVLGLHVRLGHQLPGRLHRLPPAQDRARGRAAPHPHRPGSRLRPP